MISRIYILNTCIDNLTMHETLKIIDDTISNNKRLSHVVVNASKIVELQEDIELRQSVNSCDLINADGQSVVWASQLLGKSLKERVAGIDLMENLIKVSHEKGYKIFFLGAKQEIVLDVVSHYSEKYSEQIIAGFRNGYFSKAQEKEVALEISNSGAQLLFVAISSPKKENFMHQYKKELSNVNFTMGVGGSFDVVAGLVKRAPLWIQKLGLEWLYRLIQEPRRMWKRYLIGNTKFIFIVFKETIRSLNKKVFNF